MRRRVGTFFAWFCFAMALMPWIVGPLWTNSGFELNWTIEVKRSIGYAAGGLLAFLFSR